MDRRSSRKTTPVDYKKLNSGYTSEIDQYSSEKNEVVISNQEAAKQHAYMMKSPMVANISGEDDLVARLL